MVPSPDSDYLDQKGINGTAVVLDSQQTGVYVKKNPQLKLKLEVTVPGKSPYEVNISQYTYINTPKIILEINITF